MRLKVKSGRALPANVRKNRPSNQPAVVQFGFTRVRIVQHNESDKLGMIGRQIAKKRHYVLPVVVSTVRIDLLRGSGFPGNRKPGHSSGGGGSLVAHNAAQRITNLFGSFRRDDLAQDHWRY